MSAEKSAEKRERPLSPHLQIYKPQLTSAMSILHRITGAALVVGTLMVIWMLVGFLMGPSAYGVFQGFVSSPLGTLLLFGWSVALYYHLCNGIRHFFWDAGFLFKIGNAYRAGYVVLGATAVLTAITWGSIWL